MKKSLWINKEYITRSSTTMHIISLGMFKYRSSHRSRSIKRKNKWILIGIVYWASSNHLKLFVTKSKGQSNPKDIPVSETKTGFANRHTSSYVSRSCKTKKRSFRQV